MPQDRESFGPIPDELFHEPPKGETFGYLKAIQRFNRGHRPYTWGFTIYRTVYTPGSDELFSRTIDRIRKYVEHAVMFPVYYDKFGDLRSEPLEGLPEKELLSRFQLDIYEDPQTLNGLGTGEIAERFVKWVQDFGRDQIRSTLNPRYRVCLMIDVEVMDSVLKLREDPDLDMERINYYRFVKAIPVEERPTHSDTFVPYPNERFWYRIAVVHLVRVFFVLVHWDGDSLGQDWDDGILSYWGVRGIVRDLQAPALD